MNSFSSILALLLVSIAGLPLPTEPSFPPDADWAKLESDTLPPEWAKLVERLEARSWVEAEFVERRFFSFRRGGVALTGSVWFGREEGLTLAYEKPRREMMRIDGEGVRILRKEGRPQRAPKAGREIPELLLALFQFDLARLDKSFHLSGRRDENNWALRLEPRDEDETPFQSIEIGGKGDDVTDIEIELERSRRIEIEFSNIAYPASLDDDERARRFQKE